MMKRFKHNNLFTILLLLGWAINSFAAQTMSEPELTAEQSVDNYISTLLARVEVIQPMYNDDREQYFQEVEQALSAFVDFREVARGVMAKYSTGERGASAQQLDRFTLVFKSSLVDFYGSALAEYSGGHFEMMENRRESRNPESSTNVRMNVVGLDGSNIEVQYTMFLNEERIWKLKNLYIEGVNLRRQYHSQFDSLMINNDYDIESVIEQWKIAN